MDDTNAGSAGQTGATGIALLSRLVLIGPPGSGKGTQGQVLAKELGIPHVATGDLIREIVEAGGEDAERFKAIMATGVFVPDEDVVAIVDKRLSKPDAARGYLLDGFPRSLEQARLFAATRAGATLQAAIALEIPVELLVERLSGRLTCLGCGASYHEKYRPPVKKTGVCDNCGGALVRRVDDEPVAIRQRLQTYDEKTRPLIEFYEDQECLSRIDASGTPADVHDRLQALLGVTNDK
ncbi:MAG: nucleoside monophosphate kinase [Capsulimonadaceae bacterium]|nr:nucleoside monophosphate kinase [Capsulimonadaceae bacterium]